MQTEESQYQPSGRLTTILLTYLIADFITIMLVHGNVVHPGILGLLALASPPVALLVLACVQLSLRRHFPAREVLIFLFVIFLMSLINLFPFIKNIAL